MPFQFRNRIVQATSAYAVRGFHPVLLNLCKLPRFVPKLSRQKIVEPAMDKSYGSMLADGSGLRSASRNWLSRWLTRFMWTGCPHSPATAMLIFLWANQQHDLGDQGYLSVITSLNYSVALCLSTNEIIREPRDRSDLAPGFLSTTRSLLCVFSRMECVQPLVKFQFLLGVERVSASSVNLSQPIVGSSQIRF